MGGVDVGTSVMWNPRARGARPRCRRARRPCPAMRRTGTSPEGASAKIDAESQVRWRQPPQQPGASAQQHANGRRAQSPRNGQAMPAHSHNATGTLYATWAKGSAVYVAHRKNEMASASSFSPELCRKTTAQQAHHSLFPATRAPGRAPAETSTSCGSAGRDPSAASAS